MVSSEDGRAIYESIPSVDVDPGSPAEDFGDVKGLREIAAQQPGAVEAGAGSGTGLHQLAQVQSGIHHDRHVVIADDIRREGA